MTVEELENKVWEGLRTVIDPELGENIVELGLIYKVSVQGNSDATVQRFSVKILMTLTSPACPLAGTFDFMVRAGLEGITEIDVAKDVQITLTFDPPWVQDMMSEEIKAKFGMD